MMAPGTQGNCMMTIPYLPTQKNVLQLLILSCRWTIILHWPEGEYHASLILRHSQGTVMFLHCTISKPSSSHFHPQSEFSSWQSGTVVSTERWAWWYKMGAGRIRPIFISHMSCHSIRSKQIQSWPQPHISARSSYILTPCSLPFTFLTVFILNIFSDTTSTFLWRREFQLLKLISLA